ncbi:MAG TPA: aminopeptidase [Nitrososphaerales archaeon]|nr:aminopeptidase [Nitrososphaerales archaeon]
MKSRPSKTTTLGDLEAKVAKKIISESLHLKNDESVTVETWNNGFDLARRFVIEARKIGAHPILLFEDEDAYVESVKNTPRDSAGKMGRHEYELLAATDAYFFIPNELLEGYTKRLTPAEVDQSTSYGSSWYEAAEKAKLRGARMSFGFAGKELAKMLGKRLDDVVTHQLKATLVDFGSLKKTGEELKSRLPSNGTGVLISGNSQLEFEFDDGVRVEDGIVDEDDISQGHNVAYLPPGMLVKNLKADSVSGKVKFAPSLTWRGVVNDAVLEFEKGQLVKWSSKSSKGLLDSMINDQPEGKRKISEITIGLNPLVRYGYGQDRFVSGSLGISGLEFTGIVRNGTLRADQVLVVDKGRLAH